MKTTPIPVEIDNAARALGDALLANPAMQEFLLAKQLAEQDVEFSALERALEERHASLLQRQQMGEAVSSFEINQYYKLRDKVVSHPLYGRRETAMRQVRALFEQAGSAMSSTLTIDFSSFID